MSTLPKAILFDADGTLYDSESINYEANRRTARELHDFDFTLEMFDVHVRRGSLSGPDVLRRHGLPVEDEVYVQAKLRHFASLVVTGLTLQSGLESFLQWCRSKHIRCGVVSMSHRGQLEPALEATGIASYFEVTVTVDDVGDDRKPHPQPYLLGLQLLGIEANEALAVEDTAKGIVSAQAAGLRCAGIRNDYNSDDDLKAAAVIIDNFGELKAFLTAD